MLDINKGISYEEYISSSTDEELLIINKLEKQCKLSERGIEHILCIDSPMDIAVFSMTRCQDAGTVIPFLMKLSDLNNNINVKFYYREGNEDLLYNLTGEKRIPSILLMNTEGQVARKFLEFPRAVDELIKGNTENKESIVKEFRAGKYNRYIQEDLIMLLTDK